jgi:hypothetical protein
MAIETRFYLIPFDDSPTRNVIEPQHLGLLGKAKAVGCAPIETSPRPNRTFRANYFLIRITQEEEYFADLDAQENVINVSSDTILSTESKTKLQTLGIAVTGNAENIERRIVNMLTGENTSFSAVPRFVDNPP